MIDRLQETSARSFEEVSPALTPGPPWVGTVNIISGSLSGLELMLKQIFTLFRKALSRCEHMTSDPHLFTKDEVWGWGP